MNSARQIRAFHAIKFLGLMVGYWLATFVAIELIEPGLNPPGFTGRGAWAMLIVFAGAFHQRR